MALVRYESWSPIGGVISRPNRNTTREDLVMGVDKPTKANTGVYPDIVRTSVTSLTTTGGNTYSNYDMNFTYIPPAGASLITFINCKFRGNASAPGGFDGLARLYNNGHCPIKFIDCTFEPQTVSPRWIGIHGHTFEAIRCQFTKCVDGMSTFNNNAGQQNGPINVKVEQCWIGEHAWYDDANDPTSDPDGSHSDGMQIQGGSGYIIRGNTFTGMNHPDHYNTYYLSGGQPTPQANAVMMIKPDVGDITGIDISQNWIDGGAASININHDDPRFLTNIGSISNNKFGRNQRQQGTPPFCIIKKSDITGTFVNNVFEDNGAAVAIRTG